MEVIRIVRPTGFECSPLGVYHFYPQGDYSVPADMPTDTARRCVDSGVGIIVRTKATKPENKQGRKKKHSTKRTGKKR